MLTIGWEGAGGLRMDSYASAADALQAYHALMSDRTLTILITDCKGNHLTERQLCMQVVADRFSAAKRLPEN